MRNGKLKEILKIIDLFIFFFFERKRENGKRKKRRKGELEMILGEK